MNINSNYKKKDCTCWNWNFHGNDPSCQSVGWLVCSVGRPECHDFQFHYRWSYRRICSNSACMIKMIPIHKRKMSFAYLESSPCQLLNLKRNNLGRCTVDWYLTAWKLFTRTVFLLITGKQYKLFTCNTKGTLN